jgi:hypothetical protein
MTTYEDHFRCDYLDASVSPASDMLYKCVQEPGVGYDFFCRKRSDRKNTSYADDINVIRGYATSGQDSSGDADVEGVIYRGGNGSHTEGFSNMFITDNGPGKSRVPLGECPEGYTWCSKSSRCIQVCTGCSYRDNMRSKEFNEFDPCFPEGVYNGVDRYGNMICTCGYKDKYCSKDFRNQFTAEGSLILGQTHLKNVGITEAVSKMFDVGYI